jgi:transcription elongation factor GreB
MSKAFTRESDAEVPLPETAPSDAPAGKNYMTPRGFRQMQDELRDLCRSERPRVVDAVSAAAANGDRSENGDYIYNKQRLREIDRRIRYLTKRLEGADVVDPQQQMRRDRVFFGATVVYFNEAGQEHRITIVGIDEADLAKGLVSWTSPVARALTGAAVGDVVEVRLPAGQDWLEIMEIGYPS